MENLVTKAKTSVPKSLRGYDPPPPGARRHSHITNSKLRIRLDKQAVQSARAQAMVKDAEMLASNEAGKFETEGQMERTWRISQDEIIKVIGAEAAKGRKEMVLEGGPYRVRYTRNGRHMAIVGQTGHVATFDWQTGTMHSEIQLRETCRDVTFLQDQSMYAVAQKKYVFMYDRDGVELHRLKSHLEPTRLEFLPFHWLLASVGLTGFLKYQDTSTGQIVAEHRTKLGACHTLAQNPHSAVLYLGHANGTVTLWTPNMSEPIVRLLTHLGPVNSVSIDSSSCGRYIATAGADGTVKVWDCRNWKGAVREWSSRGGAAQVEWSQRGLLAVASGGTINVHSRPSIYELFTTHVQPPLYLTHPIPHRPLVSLRFCPYQDILTVGHTLGLSSILVPGAGEPNFDSTEADPFEIRRTRREREVKGLLDKAILQIQPDMIVLDPDFIGSLAPQPKTDASSSSSVPFARLPRLARLQTSGKADETELDVDEDDSGSERDSEDAEQKTSLRREEEKKRMRGRNKSVKRYLRKQRKNVIDPKAIAIREKLRKDREARKQARDAANGSAPTAKYKPSVLDRFKRSA
ncbi:WD40-repeat-containing domain protein [Vararia minispora EC-137]|uniref:WD40-repeat-containing domain protein n=1 Tax=Vararia minispora EC-137 TaxID=1314806 RepID=A0ACB8Q4K2_9AGAM|nr:WD40-repeat-containing domain protein [Vararia minispora EC-137]